MTPILTRFRLAENVGLEELVTEHGQVVAKVGANPAVKIGTLVAGMITGAGTIDGMDLLGHGAIPATFGGIRAPLDAGSFVRALRQCAPARRGASPGAGPNRCTGTLLAGAQTLAFVDLDSVQRRVYGPPSRSDWSADWLCLPNACSCRESRGIAAEVRSWADASTV